MTASHQTSPQPVIDPDLHAMLTSELADLRAMYPHPESHGHQQALGALQALATENGVDWGSFMGETAEPGQVVPPGFRSMELLGEPVRLRGDQFKGRVLPLQAGEYSVPVWELTSDQETGDRRKVIRVCDLRPQTARALNGSSPGTAEEQARLDEAFYRDLKIFADQGVARDTVSDVAGINYTKVRGTKQRAYWTTITVEGAAPGVRIIARIGDSGNSTSYEQDLYRVLFGRKM